MTPFSISRFVWAFTFGYPFVMAWYWMSGAILYGIIRERHEPLPENPPDLPVTPGVSILIPCHNESRQLAETLAAAMAQRYPDYEVIAVNDGSTDDTGARLDALQAQYPRLRVLHLEKNQGKSTALNLGALAARHEILVCIDGDALLDPNAVTWFVRRFQSDRTLGALTGNPRIRNRSTLLGRLQVGEFSSIVGLIKRTQTVQGNLFTVSGVICAFRRRALQDAGWWSPNVITDDVDATLQLQVAGWRAAFEPKAMVWILMPETLRGLWKQRLRWAEGGTQAIMDITGPILRQRRWRMVPVWLNFVVSVLWAYCMAVRFGLWSLSRTGVIPPGWGTSPFPSIWGVVLGATYFLQSLISVSIDQRYERRGFNSLFWIVWYPIVFWMIQCATSVVGLPKAMFRKRGVRGTWISPDRGVR